MGIAGHILSDSFEDNQECRIKGRQVAKSEKEQCKNEGVFAPYVEPLNIAM